MTGCPALVGDGIENPWNARVMIHAAEMFGWECAFRDRKRLLEAWSAASFRGDPPRVTRDEIATFHSPVVAFDNAKGAADVYGFRPATGDRLGVVVGNERRGIAKDMLAIADHVVQVPMVSRRINTLNVAAASGVAMYYLTRGGGGRLQTRSEPSNNRPELLLLGATDHFELGSSIRSGAAFGWNRLLIDDRAGVWFGCDRITRSEGRGAARRGRNPIRLVPTTDAHGFAFEEVCVVTCGRDGVPIHRANLAKGPRQLVVIPDESAVRPGERDLQRLGRAVRFAHLDLPREKFVYHYRIIVTIALAEIARQVGTRARQGRARSRPPVYDRSLKLLMSEDGESVFLDDLEAY
ncbi:MAG: TrmH family RNA methyltransferase [Paracoccaceae bacterium]